MNASSYPLQWPEGWSRTDSESRRRSRYKTSPNTTLKALIQTFKRMGVPDWCVIVSTNVPVRRDGLPYTSIREPSDPGVAVYWNNGGKDFCMACDKWLHMGDNIRAILLTLEALRSIERAGASQILDRMFESFGVLPAKTEWYEFFGIAKCFLETLTLDELKREYRKLSKLKHPDHGGSESEFIALSTAYQEGCQYLESRIDNGR